MMQKFRNERGQIIVILALAMVALIGFTALAVDGSLIYNARRQDQNTADSAALAGAGAAANYLKDIQSGTEICGTETGTIVTGLIVDAVQKSVLADGILAEDMPKMENDTELAAVDQGFTVACYWYGGLGVQYLDVHVKVSTEMDTNFAQIVNQDTLKTSVESTARVYPRQPMAYGNGLVSLSDECDKAVGKRGGIFFEGGGSEDKKGTYITNGGIFSNSCLKPVSGIVDVEGGAINYWDVDGCDPKDCNDTERVNPTPIRADTKLPKDMYPAPVCPKKDSSNTDSDGSYVGKIPPGWYTNGIEVPNNGSLELEEGLYCIEGGLTNNSKSVLKAAGVTLYFLSGDVQINNNETGSVTLTSCSTKSCGAEPWEAKQGLLMYFDPSYNADVTLNGGSTNIFIGTIFGSSADFHLNGNTDILSTDYYNFSTQIIGNWIEINGNAKLVMNLKSSEFSSMDPSLSLVK